MVVVNVTNSSIYQIQLNIGKNFQVVVLGANEQHQYKLAELRPEWKTVLMSLPSVTFNVTDSLAALQPIATQIAEVVPTALQPIAAQIAEVVPTALAPKKRNKEQINEIVAQ